MTEIILLEIILVTNLFFYLMLLFTTLRKRIRFTEKEYVVCMKNLDYIVTSYIKMKLNPAITKLQSGHDLDPESQVNSIKSYQKQLDELFRESCKDIINNYLSVDHRKTLNRYLSESSLILIIITSLKDES